VRTGERGTLQARHQVPDRLAATGFAGLFGRPAARWARVALVAVNLAAITAFLVSYSRHGVGFGPYRIDLAAYRSGGWTWLHGGDLYGQVPVLRGMPMPFTYPPIAAILLAPLAVLPMTAAGTVLTVGSIALAAVVLRLFLRRLAGPATASVWAAGWLLPAALLLEPVRSTLAYGQINMVLMALVALDCLTPEPRWPRGALTGLAAAVKLTPAAFVLFFLLRRDYRAAVTAGLSFVATTAVGFALAGPDSVRYWTATVFQTGRIGDPATAANQCIQAVLARAGLDPHTLLGLAAWLALAALVVIVACRGMRQAFAASQDCLALSLNAFAALLISPMSWSHHWVWCAPALLTLADLGRGHRNRLAVVVAACGVVLFAAAPQWWLGKFAGPELGWAAWQQAVGSSYVFFAALVLVLSASGLLARQRQQLVPHSESSRAYAPDMDLQLVKTLVRLPTGAENRPEQRAAGGRAGPGLEFPHGGFRTRERGGAERAARLPRGPGPGGRQCCGCPRATGG
jgi:alpha-1,2-mannosyltransferase